MSVDIERVEIEDPWRWMRMVAQKITMADLRIMDHRDIPEEDRTLLKVLYKAFYNGEFPIYESKMEGECQSVSQVTLFSLPDSVTSTGDFPETSDKNDKNPDGIKVVNTTDVTKDKKTDD